MGNQIKRSILSFSLIILSSFLLVSCSSLSQQIQPTEEEQGLDLFSDEMFLNSSLSSNPLLNVYGFDYEPYKDDQSPETNTCPSLDDIRLDLAFIKRHTHMIRTYDILTCGLGELVLRAASENNVTVALGIPLGSDPQRNISEINELKRLAAHPEVGLKSVAFIVVGNDAQTKEGMTENDLITAINDIRQLFPEALVTTAENWHQWTAELANAVDFIYSTIHPFNDGVHIDDAVDYVFEQVDILSSYQKPVVISETGWPSTGPSIKSADASIENQATYLSNFVTQANAAKLPYFLFEMFDQPWKENGTSDAHWGFYGNDRLPKHPNLITP